MMENVEFIDNAAVVEDSDVNVDEDDSDDEDRINIMDGLSAEVLAALLEFQLGNGDNDTQGDDSNVDSTSQRIGKDTLCATYRPEDASRIAETLRRLHDRDQAGSNIDSDDRDDVNDTTYNTERIILPMLETIPRNEQQSLSLQSMTQQLAHRLEMEGVIRINNILSPDLCVLCRNYINESLETIENPKSSNTTSNDETFMFGNVFERNNRYDMYMHPSNSIVQQILQSILQKQSKLGQLFQQLLRKPHQQKKEMDQQQHQEIDDVEDEMNPSKTTIGNEHSNSTPLDAEFHELSSLVSDPGSMAQPIHPDAKYYPCYAPMWTVFIALQNIKQDMGGTVVVPTTHTENFHKLIHQQKQHQKDIRTVFRKECQFYRADLNIGDCIVMDARTFHYGGANQSSSDRRTLFYFTIRNPFHEQTGYPDCNSIYPDLDGTLKLLQYY